MFFLSFTSNDDDDDGTTTKTFVVEKFVSFVIIIITRRRTTLTPTKHKQTHPIQRNERQYYQQTKEIIISRGSSSIV